jgi:hypothetical protein
MSWRDESSRVSCDASRANRTPCNLFADPEGCVLPVIGVRLDPELELTAVFHNPGIIILTNNKREAGIQAQTMPIWSSMVDHNATGQKLT